MKDAKQDGLKLKRESTAEVQAERTAEKVREAFEMTAPWGEVGQGGVGAAKLSPNPQLWAPQRATEVPLQGRHSYGEAGHDQFCEEQGPGTHTLVPGSPAQCTSHPPPISQGTGYKRATQQIQP